MLDKWWVLLFSFFIIFLLPLIRPAFWFPSTAYCQKLTMFCSRAQFAAFMHSSTWLPAKESGVTKCGDAAGKGNWCGRDCWGARRMLYFFSMPLVDPLPGLVAQQKTESSPHFSQTCFTSSLGPCLPSPATLM